MEHRNALEQKNSKGHTWLESGCMPAAEGLIIEHGVEDIPAQQEKEALTPYHPNAWVDELSKHNLYQKYPHLPENLIRGFDVGIPLIKKTYSPCNSPSINSFLEAYSEITKKEFAAGRYLGPFSERKVEDLIGPFQSSPLSFVAKSAKPGKYHAVVTFDTTIG